MSATILVVDDSATDRLIIKNMLSSYTILTACDGVEAMHLIETNADIDLIILDLNMPNMDGFQVLDSLKEQKRFEKLRTIILTNYDELDKEIQGLKAGAVDYIRKPIHMDSLIVRIGIHLELLKLQQFYEEKLYERSLTLDAIFDQAPIGIVILRDVESAGHFNDHFVKTNPFFEQILGREKEELMSLSWRNVTHPEDLNKELENFSKLKTGEISNYTMEKRYVKPDGSYIWVHIVVAPLQVQNDMSNNYICLVEDITERKNMEDNLKFISEHDSWTGLHNRNYFVNLLQQDVVHAPTVKSAIIGINLSNINSLSLSYGFQYSQALIKRVATALSSHCTGNHRLFNTYAYRFAFYIKEYAGQVELMAFCKTIKATLEPMLALERVNGGLGVIEINDENKMDVEQILKNLLIASEKALNHPDQEFSYSFFDTEMEAQIVREEEIKMELTEVVKEENNQQHIFLVFQPIVDLKANRINGFEALTRLQSDKLGLVSPLEFIPIAEKTKLIIPIGQIIIQQSLVFLERLNSKGYTAIGISINISATQLLRHDFNENLIKLIHEKQIDPARITLEITESVFSDNYHEINRKLAELKELGIKIAIDDFGTGYSSLSRERELNVNCIKIDKAFIDRITLINSEQLISGDIISMAHKMGHAVVAEGVEYEIQRQYLFDHDCDMVQGYLFSKPVDEEAAITLIQNTWGE